MQSLEIILVEPCYDVRNCFLRSNTINEVATNRSTISFLVWFPLAYVQVFLCCIRVYLQFHTHIIQALKGAHTRSTNSNGTTIIVEQSLQRVSTHTNVFCMHGVTINLLALHRLKGSGTNMQS